MKGNASFFLRCFGSFTRIESRIGLLFLNNSKFNICLQIVRLKVSLLFPVSEFQSFVLLLINLRIWPDGSKLSIERSYDILVDESLIFQELIMLH